MTQIIILVRVGLLDIYIYIYIYNRERRAAGGYLLARVLHRWARSYLQALRSGEPWHDSRHGCTAAHMAKFEYADDAALIYKDAGQATERVTSLAAGSIADAAMIISPKKSKVMHIHKTTRTSATTEADVAKLNLVHRCESCTREFTKLRGLEMHIARWCDGGRTQRSRL